MKKRRLNRKKVNISTPVYTGENSSDRVGLQLFKYNDSGCWEDKNYESNKFKGFIKDNFHYWLNIDGIHDVDLVKDICLKMNIHNLAIQDILDVNQRTKFQDYENYWFFSIKSITPSEKDEIEKEQMSFVLGENFLISFQEKKGDCFEHIKERLRKNIGIVRDRSSDYLLYLLLESILDNYVKTVDQIDDKIEELGFFDYDQDPSPEIIKSIERYKRQVNIIKKTISTIKEFLYRTDRGKLEFIKEEHLKYYLDLRDMCMSLIDDCDSLSGKMQSNINLFFFVQGDRMNRVMKTLTVVATIFSPLTFIAGVYGMNFLNMPELGWKYGYFIVWGLMIAIFLLMILYFKKKKWY
ncbi:MAG: magnesium/cobalt transporter CorA [Prolixibacteraceae bacterium]|nr:magnesium/cobalt transporter CorA [Prolixibacteraceae bacterium]